MSFRCPKTTIPTQPFSHYTDNKNCLQLGGNNPTDTVMLNIESSSLGLSGDLFSFNMF